MDFDGNLGFLHYLQLASHELATIGINVTKNEIPNPNPRQGEKLVSNALDVFLIEVDGSVGMHSSVT